jgi:ubiquinone/menaquinone biosynthesis C-methylase UbiE
VTSSNSLSEAERDIYLIETHRVLKPGGYFFVKALCKDGDGNAKTLLRKFPGREKDTYVMPDMGVVERIWSKEDFVATYEKYFTILHLEKKTSYSRMNDRSYKRNFWIAYLKKNR